MIRVLLFNYSSEIGGAEASLLTYMRYADRKKVDLTLLTCGSGELEGYAADLKVKLLRAVPHMTFGIWKRDSLLKILFTHPLAVVDIVRQIFEIRAIIKKNRPDILHCNNPKSAVIGALAAIGTKVRLIWHVRDVFPKRSFAVFALGAISAVVKPRSIAISSFVFNSMPRNMQKRGQIVSNGVSMMPAVKGRQKLRTMLSIALNDKIVLCAGRLVEWKGPEELIKAMTPFIRSAGYHLVFAGSATYGNADYVHRLKMECMQYSVTDNVHFLGYRSDMGDVYAAADVLILASRREPFGRVLAEAQLAGLPCVAYEEGGAIEIITHNETGLLAEPGNAADLCRKAIHLLEDPILLKRIAITAQTKALTLWSPKQSARKIEEIYENQ
ncbi:MAG: glycosyltransferase family 4 protein [Fibrobacteres bacterium]|nr:glycosyltransferase family 4 protein [Fibrobacterota bacterium]